MTRPRILVIDDEPGLRHTLSVILGDEGYTVRVAEDGEAGVRIAAEEPKPELILCDVRMPRLDGLGFLRRYRESGGEALVIMMSAYGTLDSAVEALHNGAYDYVSKPFNADEILLALRKAEEREQLRREVARLRRQVGEGEGFAGVIGGSRALREVIELARRVAAYPSTVLLTGESGTGKEAIARAIHRSSPRSEQAFVAVNCGAIPENLLESELFGHEKGAFTGATQTREGLFAEAHGGTLFLDEIGELPSALQVKLLRAVQERTVRPVGASVERAVDVRLLAATARDLSEEVRAGRFREDLFYRVNVVQLHLPPLRARREDIPALAEHFLDRHGERFGIAAPLIGSAVLPVLVRYPWPGNVRELENTVERALVLSGGHIRPEHLPEHVRRGEGITDIAASDGDLSVKRRLPALEKELIARALEQTGGNRTRAAEVLELSPRALTYKIQDYELG
ncbi:sigma-54 dependent transcriptional regulator [soil metagenome]